MNREILRPLLLASALLAGLAGCSPQRAPADLLAAVRADLAGEPGESGAPDTRRLRSMFKRVDANGDDRPDWLLDWGKLGSAAYCGTGGCRQQIYVASLSGPLVLAFDAQADTVAFKPMGDRTGLTVSLHGTFCGRTGSEACRRSFVWNLAEQRFEEVVDPLGGARLTSPLFQPVVVQPWGTPTEAVRVRAEQRALCRNAGLALDESDTPPATRIPDINGDGRSDWIVGSPYLRCAAPDADPGLQSITPPVPGLVVLVSGAAEGERALETDRTDYVLDISSRPARFASVLDAADCGELTGPACPERAYRWNPTARRLEAVR